MIVILPVLVACGMVGGPVSGVVLDAETKQPIEGAYVVAKWSGSSSVSIAESQTVCIYIDMATTDEKGRFRIPMWLFEKPGVSGQWRSITVYKPGYLPAKQADDGLYMNASKESLQERVEYMKGVLRGSSCRGNDAREKHLLQLATALYDESVMLAGGKYNPEIGWPFLYRKERLENEPGAISQ
ncbi:MAG: hypothetical protein FD165_654 [Gammaproteobacteria bacterium]|nr:MAG: hypothetical protein FD165_654 [Gammaproteobacteria bacterium]TND06981.1 MAG: hypothetical protein FD120_149 [Gammaproteobacteria bacterium]